MEGVTQRWGGVWLGSQLDVTEYTEKIRYSFVYIK